MTGWHLLRLWGVVTAFAALTVIVVMLWPLLWPSDPDTSLTLHDGKLTGETGGYVWRVEPDRQRIHVTSSLLGLRAVAFTVTADTKVIVNNKLGGFGDIWKGMDVRVSYQMRDSTRVATSVELLTAGKSRRSRTNPADVPTDAAVEPGPRPVVTTPAGPSRGAPPVPPPPSAAPVQRPAKPAAASSPSAPPRPAAPASVSQPSEADPADGSAAVDWLLKGSRR